MGEIVNLRRARKRKERRRDEAAAAERRLVFGRSKAERRLGQGERAKAERDLESHRIARPDAE
jgi:hypothetical protein